MRERRKERERESQRDPSIYAPVLIVKYNHSPSKKTNVRYLIRRK